MWLQFYICTFQTQCSYWYIEHFIRVTLMWKTLLPKDLTGDKTRLVLVISHKRRTPSTPTVSSWTIFVSHYWVEVCSHVQSFMILLQILTQLSWSKWRQFSKDNISNTFIAWKLLYLIPSSLKSCIRHERTFNYRAICVNNYTLPTRWVYQHYACVVIPWQNGTACDPASSIITVDKPYDVNWCLLTGISVTNTANNQ